MRNRITARLVLSKVINYSIKTTGLMDSRTFAHDSTGHCIPTAVGPLELVVAILDDACDTTSCIMSRL